MIATKERTPAQIQHRRDTVRANVARYRARKKLMTLHDTDLSTENSFPCSTNRYKRFVNKTSSDFQPRPTDPGQRTKRNAGHPSRSRLSNILAPIDGVDEIRLDLVGHLASDKPYRIDPPPASCFYMPQHQPSCSSPTLHHWLTLLPQYAESLGNPFCLTLTAHAIALRAKATVQSCPELVRRSEHVYGAALKAFRIELEPNLDTAEISPGKTRCDAVVFLATALALATYELSELNPIFSSISRWASHISGLDAFVTAHRTTIYKNAFGHELLRCWATQRSWLECLSACGALEALSPSSLCSKEIAINSPTSSVVCNADRELTTDTHDSTETPLDANTLRTNVHPELMNTALDLMTSCAYILRAAARVKPLLHHGEPQDVVQYNLHESSAILTRIGRMKTRLSAVREDLQAQDVSTAHDHTDSPNRTKHEADKGQLGPMGLLQVKLFDLSAELTLAKAEAAAFSMRHDMELQSSELRSIGQITAELCHVCDVLANSFGFIGQLCGVLPRALAAHGEFGSSEQGGALVD